MGITLTVRNVQGSNYVYAIMKLVVQIFVIVAGQPSQSTHEDNYVHKTLYALFKQCSALCQCYAKT